MTKVKKPHRYNIGSSMGRQASAVDSGQAVVKESTKMATRDCEDNGSHWWVLMADDGWGRLRSQPVKATSQHYLINPTLRILALR